jgi:hypothetical protein
MKRLELTLQNIVHFSVVSCQQAIHHPETSTHDILACNCLMMRTCKTDSPGLVSQDLENDKIILVGVEI